MCRGQGGGRYGIGRAKEAEGVWKVGWGRARSLSTTERSLKWCLKSVLEADQSAMGKLGAKTMSELPKSHQGLGSRMEMRQLLAHSSKTGSIS